MAYRRLLRAFGPQGWWPVTPDGEYRPRYHPGKLLDPTEREATEIAFGAILTQNTAWWNVERALEGMRRSRAVDLRAVERMPPGRLGRMIRSSGYFRQKAIKLKAFARHALAKGTGLRRWLGGNLAALREELLEIHGIGPETADSILLYAGGRPAFVVDAYTLRIGGRVGWFKAAGYAEAQRYLTQRLPRSVRVYQEFHALLVALAKYFCRPEPLCGGCPLGEDCAYANRSR